MKTGLAEGPIADCLAARISPEVALARLLLAGHTAAGIGAALQRHPSSSPHWAAMARLLADRGPALDALAHEVAATAANHDASGTDGVGRIAAFFDRAVAHSPEAGVALYSLGDPAILARATSEVVAWLDAGGWLHGDALDLGCGIGRMAAALAPRCAAVLGLDVSAGMVAEAQRRHAGLVNVRFAQTAGDGLDALPGAGFDLVLAVDSFPYIVQAGRAAAHVAGAARVLRPGGALVVLNYSYRGDPQADAADAAALAAEHGLALEQAGTTPFAVWDGVAFVFRR